MSNEWGGRRAARHPAISTQHALLVSATFPALAEAEAARLAGDPGDEGDHPRVGAQPFQRVPFAFQLFFGKEGVELRVAGLAEPNRLPDRVAVELALVPFVVMTRARNQMVPRQPLFAPAKRAEAGCF